MRLLLSAANFAAIKHTCQRRKNVAASPYINHPIEVAELLCSVGGVEDEPILIAALLHDTIEDTETSEQEIAEAFGSQVLSLVLECTDDKSLKKQERKRLQIVNAPKKSSGAKQIKIADKICNLRSIRVDPPDGLVGDPATRVFRVGPSCLCGSGGRQLAVGPGGRKKILDEGLRYFRAVVTRRERERNPAQSSSPRIDSLVLLPNRSISSPIRRASGTKRLANGVLSFASCAT